MRDGRIVFCVVLLLTLQSCKGDGESTAARPVVRLRGPVSGSAFEPGDRIPFAAVVQNHATQIVEFTSNETPFRRDALPPYVIEYRARVVGTYDIRARTTDAAGEVVVSAPIRIEVHPPMEREITSDDVAANLAGEQGPVAELVTPTTGAVFLTAPPGISIIAEARGRTSRLARVDFVVDGTPVGSASQPPFVFTWQRPPPGRHLVYVRATDANQNIGLSNEASVLIAAHPMTRE